MSLAQDIFDIIVEISGSLPLSLSQIENTVRVALPPAANLSNEYVRVFRSTSEGMKPISGVELRLPGQASRAGDGMVILSIAPDIRIEQGQVTQRFGAGALSVPTPREPVDAPVYLVYRLPWGTLSFGFARSIPSYLTRVVLDPSQK